MPFYLEVMTLPKSLVVVLAMLTLCLLSSCSIQKRTTAPGWHVEKAPSLFHQIGGPSSSLTPAVKPEPLALQRLDRLPPRALDWTTSTLPTDTSAVDAKLRKQVTRALQREIELREANLMFPHGLSNGYRKREAEKWHDKAEQRCLEQDQFLNEVAPDEFARLESLRYPSRETMQELKRKKRLIILAPFVVLMAVIALLLPLIAGAIAIQG